MSSKIITALMVNRYSCGIS